MPTPKVPFPNALESPLSLDKKGIKIWEAESGAYWSGVEPAVDLNHVEWVPDSGMILTANEGRQQHAFFIPQLGPAPKWCAFLDNLVEEMAEDADDPNAFKSSGTGAGEVYDNFITWPIRGDLVVIRNPLEFVFHVQSDITCRRPCD